MSTVIRQGWDAYIELKKGATLRGRATDAGGKPVIGAIISQTGTLFGFHGIRAARTDVEGRYEIRDMPLFDWSERRKLLGKTLGVARGKSEEELAALKSKIEAISTAPWWQRIAGTFEKDRVYEKAMELGRQYRQSQNDNGSSSKRK